MASSERIREVQAEIDRTTDQSRLRELYTRLGALYAAERAAVALG